MSLKELKEQLFILDMKDCWDLEDYATADALRKQIRELEEMEALEQSED